ncbi:MAG: hypothetical protein ACPG6V_11330 [Flavobacteriales bacterium]
MRTLFLGCLIVFTLFSCKEKSTIFENCRCDKVSLENGITISDSLNHFQMTYPDSSWNPLLNLDSYGNGISVGDSSQGYFRIFAINEFIKRDTFIDWEIEQNKIEQEFNVVEKGEKAMFIQNVHWNLVKFDDENPSYWSLFLTIYHPIDNRFYTLNLTVEDGINIKERICTLENFIGNFYMKSKIDLKSGEKPN